MNKNKFISDYDESESEEVDLYQQMMLDDLENGNDLYTERALSESEMKAFIEGNGSVGGSESDEDFECDYGDDFGSNYQDEETGIQMKTNQQKQFPTNSETEYQNQLAIGTLTETEHLSTWTDEDPDIDEDLLMQIAENIAKDHLKQKPDYYTRLIKAGLVDEQDALDLYTSIYGSIEPVVTAPKKTSLPLPKKKVPTQNITSYDDDVKIAMDILDQDEAEITVDPKVRTSQIMTDTPRKKIVLDDIDDYGDLSESVDSSFEMDYKFGNTSGGSSSGDYSSDPELSAILSGDFEVDGE